MRKINLHVVHCSATRHSSDHLDREYIRYIHVEKNGWRDIGYHFIITRDGTIQRGRPLSWVGAHVRGHNLNSVATCLMGGLDDELKATEGIEFFTDEQAESLLLLNRGLMNSYPIERVCGHRDLSPDVNGDGIITPDEWMKRCPTFDAAEFVRSGHRDVG